MAKPKELTLTINGRAHRYRGDPAQPLLWMLRDELQLLGTKYGCGSGLCGACVVHVDGRPQPSCVTTMAAVAGRRVTTIEALGAASPGGLHAVQRAWIEHDVPQCGYCQSGQMMTAAALVEHNAAPDDRAIDDALRGHLCRCGTYVRIRAAVKRAAVLRHGEKRS